MFLACNMLAYAGDVEEREMHGDQKATGLTVPVGKGVFVIGSAALAGSAVLDGELEGVLHAPIESIWVSLTWMTWWTSDPLGKARR